MSEAPTVPYKKYHDVQIALDNIDAERCYLRERLREKQALLQGALHLIKEALEIPEHYAGQNNKYELDPLVVLPDGSHAPVSAGPIPITTTSGDQALVYSWKEGS